MLDLDESGVAEAEKAKHLPPPRSWKSKKVSLAASGGSMALPPLLDFSPSIPMLDARPPE